MTHLIPDLSLSSVRTPSVIPSCPICGQPLRGRQTVCSSKCRIARSRQRHERAQVELDARVRLLLTEVLALMQD
jgi:predicted nucleic acid-binding Zn ribbon protein